MHNATFLVISLLAQLSLSLYADENIKLDKAELKKLILSVPSQDMIENAKNVVRNNKGISGMDKSAADEIIKKTKEAIPKLRKVIKTETNILDYPGLIACGKINYENDEKYSLYLGIYLRGDEGKDQYDFRILFDDKGKILEVNNVVWKQ